MLIHQVRKYSVLELEQVQEQVLEQVQEPE